MYYSRRVSSGFLEALEGPIWAKTQRETDYFFFDGVPSEGAIAISQHLSGRKLVLFMKATLERNRNVLMVGKVTSAQAVTMDFSARFAHCGQLTYLSPAVKNLLVNLEFHEKKSPLFQSTLLPILLSLT